MSPEIADLVKAFGIPLAILIVVLVSGAKGLWVYGRTYDEMAKRAEKFEELALRAVSTAESVAETGKQLTESTPQPEEIAAAVAEILTRRGAKA